MEMFGSDEPTAAQAANPVLDSASDEATWATTRTAKLTEDLNDDDLAREATNKVVDDVLGCVGFSNAENDGDVAGSLQSKQREWRVVTQEVRSIQSQRNVERFLTLCSRHSKGICEELRAERHKKLDESLRA